jgi:hypothetical protein
MTYDYPSFESLGVSPDFLRIGDSAMQSLRLFGWGARLRTCLRPSWSALRFPRARYTSLPLITWGSTSTGESS